MLRKISNFAAELKEGYDFVKDAISFDLFTSLLRETAIAMGIQRAKQKIINTIKIPPMGYGLSSTAETIHGLGYLLPSILQQPPIPQPEPPDMGLGPGPEITHHFFMDPPHTLRDVQRRTQQGCGKERRRIRQP